jgi:hypothetical protein
VIVLFGPSDPVVWAPWKTECAVLASKADPIESISVSAVRNALANLSVGQVQ